MHRSGTSLITRILNLLGVYLGREEHMVRSLSDNPKGFWEHTFFNEQINEVILQILHGSWDTVPQLPSGWENMSELAPLRDKAREFIDREFAYAELWGWKDPRTCLTLPFWQSLLGPMRYVICLRNPLDVALSLQHRNKMSLAAGSRLWLAHHISAWQHTANEDCCTVWYEDVMQDWEKQATRLAAFIGKPEAARKSEVRKAIADTVSAELYHHATPLANILCHTEIEFAAKAMFLLLRLAGESGEMMGSEWKESLPAMVRTAYSNSRAGDPVNLSQLTDLQQALCRRQQELDRRLLQIRQMETTIGWRLLVVFRRLRGLLLPLPVYLRIKTWLSALLHSKQ